MRSIRLTHNAVVGFQHAVCPDDSATVAYRRLREACGRARYSEDPPPWLAHPRNDTDGYLLLDDDELALPVRHGRAVGCLVRPSGET